MPDGEQLEAARCAAARFAVFPGASPCPLDATDDNPLPR
jgi:hypothetical protein